MSPIDERLKSLNIVLPDVMPPVVDGYVPAFAPFIRSGDQIHLSGRLGKEGGKLLCGKVDDEISLDQVHRRRYHSCRRSFWNQWCAYGSLLKGSTSTNPALS